MKNIERFLNYGADKNRELFNTFFELALKEAIAEQSPLKIRQITEHLISVREWSENGEDESKLHSTNRESKSVASGVPKSDCKKKGKNNSVISGGIQNKSTK